ncbi:MAG: two-component sensor histidine kinase [Dysgonamonadaceae bacterium]|jgi:signal transduction histidine kinase|nr:two-component sensor histidine kinase [Dysgonamonadaceae bacterium]
MRLSYRQKIFLYFFVVFAMFTCAVVLFEESREKKYKKEIFESDQKVYTEFVHLYITHNQIGVNNMDRLNGLLPLLPEKLRITIIDDAGKVIFDNDITSVSGLENHLDRPEIQKARLKEFGSDVRRSTSMNKEFMYYTIHYDGYYIRVASPYDVEVKDFFKSDNVFLYFIIFLLFAVLIVLIYLSNRFGQSITQLKDFVLSAKDGNVDLRQICFPDDELGEIGDEIVDLYKRLEDSRKKILMEREKLLQHFQSVEEGVCFFTPERKKVYSNSHFMQYLNILCDRPTLNTDALFFEPVFSGLQAFWEKEDECQSPLYEEKIEKNGKYYQLKSILFDDGSFEVTIDNITKTEKTRLLKQEMTNNIAHELRTPVTSIRGYLETLKEQPGIEAEKRQFFINRSYAQIIRLSELIQDISVLEKIEEAVDRFEIELVNIRPLLNELQVDLSDRFQQHHIEFKLQVDDSVKIEGNRMLLYSVFRNLVDNSIAYAGNDITICVTAYMEDDEFYYFSYYDTGDGVDEHFLSRLFERFYRVNEGRTRDTGGSGLGLSIVKNAVLFHKGEITAKNRKEGGLEFLFTLKKKR